MVCDLSNVTLALSSFSLSGGIGRA